MNSKAQALLDAQLAFIEQKLKSNSLISEEVLGFFDWFRQQNIANLWSSELINGLLQQQILSTPARTQLIQQIEQHIAIALQHPQNIDTTLEDILPVETIDQLAQYISSKTEHRKKLIKSVVNNPAYVELVANIVQQSIKDYMDNSMVAKKVPGVGSLMKMGKAAIEKATDSNLDDALGSYLHKNFNKLSTLSEKLINQHFDDEKLYHLQAKIWHKIKQAPISTLQQYIVLEDLSNTVSIGEQVWNHLRQTPYLKAQVATGVEAWLQRHEQETFAKALSDLNVDENLLRSELYELIIPIIEQLINDGYLMQRIRVYLEEFYHSEQVQNILAE